jgi:hypothetical protein
MLAEKGDIGFPGQAVTACLKALSATLSDIAVAARGSRPGPVDHVGRDELSRRLDGFQHHRGCRTGSLPNGERSGSSRTA